MLAHSPAQESLLATLSTKDVALINEARACLDSLVHNIAVEITGHRAILVNGMMVQDPVGQCLESLDLPEAPAVGYALRPVANLAVVDWESVVAANPFLVTVSAVVHQRGVVYTRLQGQDTTKDSLILRAHGGIRMDKQPSDFAFCEYPTVDNRPEELEKYMNNFVRRCSCESSFYFVGEVHNISSRKMFGLADVAELSSGVLQDKLKRQHPGINTSYVYCGKKHSSSPLHVEDAWLCSKNMARAGWKLWLLVNPDGRSKLEAKLTEVLDTSDNPHSDFVRDHEVFIAPEQDREWNIRYTLEMQGPGDVIITYPETYHQVLDLTDTLAEAINFAPSGWRLSSGYKFRNRSKHPTALSAEDFDLAEEQQRVMIQYGRKRERLERLAVGEIRTPLEKRYKSAVPQLLTPPSTTGSRPLDTVRKMQSRSARSINRLARISTPIANTEDEDTDIEGNSGSDNDSSSYSSNDCIVDERTPNTSTTDKSSSQEDLAPQAESPESDVEMDSNVDDTDQYEATSDEDLATTGMDQDRSLDGA